MSKRKAYSTDLSDTEWEIIAPLLPGQQQRGRKLQYERREIVNGIFYLNRNGCNWRDLPHDLPPYRTVSHYYHTWRRAGLWQELNDTLRTAVREAEGRDSQPSAGCLDSQSVKTTEIASPRGYIRRGLGSKPSLVTRKVEDFDWTRAIFGRPQNG